MARPEDAPYAFNERSIEFDVRKDGTYDYLYSEEIEVLQEGRKQEIGTRRIPYNSRTSKLEVLQAAVINGAVRQDVDPKYIEDKTLSSSEQGFDDFNQLVVAFPDVRAGSKLVLKFRLRTREVPFENHFSERIFFGAGFFQRAGRITVRSEMPIFVEKNDRDSLLEVVHKTEKSRHLTEIRLLRPLYLDEVNEHKARFTFGEMSWAVVSTHSRYEDLIGGLAPRYEETIAVGLPAPFQQIREAAAKEADPVAAVNRVTSLLAERVRYTGDWRPIRGGHVPRPLAVIAATGFGDCKDMAATTAAILRALEFEASVAWVQRDVKPDPFPKIALQTAFNHAIVWARKAGRVFWVDPTNLQSFAQGTFEDISLRPALVIDGSRPRWEQIGGDDPAVGTAREVRRVRQLSGGVSRIQSDFSLLGRAAVDVTGLGLRQSLDVIRYRFATLLSRESDIQSYDVKLDDVSSRVARDLKFEVKIDERRSASLTTAGMFYRIPARDEVIDLLTIERKDRVSGFFLGHPKTLSRDIVLEDITLVGTVPKPCRVDSPWLTVSRTFEAGPSRLRIREEARFRRLMLTGEEIRSEAFGKLQTALKRCYELSGVIYRPVAAVSPLRATSAKH